MDLSLGCTRMLIDECKRQGPAAQPVRAYVLPTSFWETAHTICPVVEAYRLSEAWRKKNLRYYPWHGRGFVQLTREKNYERAERETGQPIHQNPALALDPAVAAKLAVTGMKEGWFTGRDLDELH
ncbi:hypothetical protein FJ960_14965 [Mesorhizobium sp. B2-3-11]|uniref:hypothetical protein n=1 Tax=Mesorhizobium sp. B2-3-11 TaxID=2589953 RepID=UPI00112929C8|nr:hypothetical protein [Mesorhizobium sp. B2-3-11]TPM03769.1 hypothetical protein FJ960_14965 [Mesorhizobium sp. B2-3-11]